MASDHRVAGTKREQTLNSKPSASNLQPPTYPPALQNRDRHHRRRRSQTPSHNPPQKSGATFPWPRSTSVSLLRLGQAPLQTAEPVPNAYGFTVTLKVLATVAPAASVTRNVNDLAPTWPADGVQVKRPVVGLMVVGPGNAGAVTVGAATRTQA